MKRTSKKILSLFLSILMVISIVPVAFAAGGLYTSSDEPISVVIQTDKSSYKKTGIAEFKVVVANTSDYTIEDVSAAAVFSDLKPTNKKSVMTLDKTDLAAGQSKEFTFYARLKDEKLNFFNKIGIWFVELFKGKATAPEIKQDNTRYSFDTVATVKVGENVVTQKVRVWCKNGIELKVDDHPYEVTNSEFTLTGTVESDAALSDVTYSLVTATDEEDATTKTGSAMIDGDKWSIDLLLYRDENEICVTATDVLGRKSVKKVTVNYDGGTGYELTSENEISVSVGDSIVTGDDITAEDLENGTIYVNDILLIIFDNDVSESEKEEIIDLVDGTLVGQLNGINQYEVRLPEAKTIEEFEEIIAEVESYPQVLMAYYDTIHLNTSNAYTPNDPFSGEASNLLKAELMTDSIENGEDPECFENKYWYGSAVNQNDWTDNDVDGNNWWLEAINAVKAWGYNDKFSNIKIGVVDSSFDTNHEDLKITMLNEQDEITAEDVGHGTHVAGIIGAKADNGKGIRGIVNNCKLLGFNYDKWVAFERTSYIFAQIIKKGTSQNKALEGLTKTVEAGAKVVNFSLGMGNGKDESSINEYGEISSKAMGVLLEKGHDFVVVQSAGNDGIDAIKNGLFASITESNCYSSSKVSKQDIMNRIIIVASARIKEDGTYICNAFSNGGSQVDIAAPGYLVYSTLPKTIKNNSVGTVNGYGYYSGTSMAAPVVTGVASLVWSVNPGLTGEEVKEIVCETAIRTVYDNPDSETRGNFRLVDAYAAVKEAVDSRYGDGTVSMKFVDAVTGQTINNVTVTDMPFIGSSSFSKTTTNGTLSINAPAGTYHVRISTEGYVDNYATITIRANKEISIGTIALSKSVSEDEVRIVLRWGERPRDLDSHFVGTTNAGERMHAYFSDKYDTSDPVWLDIDDIDSYGPETITLKLSEFNNGFTYYVHNYSDSYADSSDERAINLALSEANVDVYVGNSLVKSFSIPTNRKGTVWKVFSMSGSGRITYLNEFEYESYAGDVGSES